MLRATQPATADDSSVYQQTTAEDAIAACTRMLALNPRNANAYVVCGAAYFRKGDYGDAISGYDSVMRLDSKCTNAYVAAVLPTSTMAITAAQSPTSTGRSGSIRNLLKTTLPAALPTPARAI